MKSFSNKVTMCAFMVVSMVGVADAAQVIVLEAPFDNWSQEVSADFAANRELGRAWIDVELTTRSVGEEAQERQIIPKAVEGFYYDSARKQVLYRSPTETIVCSEDANFLWRTYLKSTGQCLLTVRTEHRPMDDGFRISERTVAKVVFQAQISSASQPAAVSRGMTHEMAVGK